MGGREGGRERREEVGVGVDFSGFVFFYLCGGTGLGGRERRALGSGIDCGRSGICARGGRGSDGWSWEEFRRIWVGTSPLSKL